jgi:hypothetical protein
MTTVKIERAFIHLRSHIQLFYSKLRPTFEPDYSTLEQTSFFQNSFVQKRPCSVRDKYYKETIGSLILIYFASLNISQFF